MSVTTDFLSLVKPGGGSTGLITPPDRVDIDVLNDNFQKIDDWAEKQGTEFNRAFMYAGPAASIGSVTPAPKDGDTYQETDGNKILWKRVGGVWVTNEGGLYLIRPASVVNGTINADGSINVTAGQTALSINGCFSPRFKKYRAEFFWHFSAAGSPSIRLRNAGADNATSNYIAVSVEGQGTTATVFTTPSSADWPTANVNNQRHWGHYEFSNVGQSGAGLLKTVEMVINSAVGNNPGVCIRSGRLDNGGGFDSQTFDGFTVFVGGGPTFNAQSWIKVYGLA